MSLFFILSLIEIPLFLVVEWVYPPFEYPEFISILCSISFVRITGKPFLNRSN